MTKRTCTEQLEEEFNALKVDGECHPTVDHLPAWLSDPASVETGMVNEEVTVIMKGNAPSALLEPAPAPVELEAASAPAFLDGTCAVVEEAAKRQRRFAQVVLNAFGGSDPRVAAQEIMAFAATEVETVAYGVPVQPEEGGASGVIVTAVPEAVDPDLTEDEDIGGFYGMGISHHDAPSVDLAPRWSYLDRYPNPLPPRIVKIDPATMDPPYYRLLTTLLKDAVGIGDKHMIDKLTAMGVDPDYVPPVLPPSPGFLVEEKNAVMA
jgi:hypothetical protein